MRINGHSHLLPYPQDIPSFMREKEIFWVDDDKQFMLQKGWKRPVTDSSFFLNEKLEWMDKNKIDHAVVLNLSQLYGNGLRLEGGFRVKRRIPSALDHRQNETTSSVLDGTISLYTSEF